jgi:hypothetical protein
MASVYTDVMYTRSGGRKSRVIVASHQKLGFGGPLKTNARAADKTGILHTGRVPVVSIFSALRSGFRLKPALVTARKPVWLLFDTEKLRTFGALHPAE